MSGWQQQALCPVVRYAFYIGSQLLRITSWGLLVVSLLFAMLAAWYVIDPQRFRAHPLCMENTVTRHIGHRIRTDERGVTYEEVNEITGLFGRRIDALRSTNTGQPDWCVGKTLVLLVITLGPARERPEDWIFPMVLGGFALFGFAGVALLRLGASRMAADVGTR